jgi:MraZ protein
MNYFNDKYLHSIDQKGRLLLPRDIRDHFEIKKGDTLYLIPNSSEPPYLEIRTEAQWESYCESLMQQESNVKKKDFLRYARISQESVTMDGQGRLIIPQRLRDQCKLTKSVAVINMDRFIEVWDKSHVEARYHEMMKAFRELNDLLF